MTVDRRLLILALGWLSAALMAARLASAQGSGSCPDSALERGMTVIVVSETGVQVRRTPAGTPVDRLPAGSTLTALGWPVCREGLLWRQVAYRRADAWSADGPAPEERTGWVAEYAANGQPLLMPLAAFVLTAPTETPPPTATPTPTPTATPSFTITPTPTATFTPSPTFTPWTPAPRATLNPTVWSQPFTVWAW